MKIFLLLFHFILSPEAIIPQRLFFSSFSILISLKQNEIWISSTIQQVKNVHPLCVYISFKKKPKTNRVKLVIHRSAWFLQKWREIEYSSVFSVFMKESLLPRKDEDSQQQKTKKSNKLFMYNINLIVFFYYSTLIFFRPFVLVSISVVWMWTLTHVFSNTYVDEGRETQEV